MYATCEEPIFDRIIDAKNFQNGYQVKVMVDGGQDFLKMCRTVFPEDYDPLHY